MGRLSPASLPPLRPAERRIGTTQSLIDGIGAPDGLVAERGASGIG